jgi:tetratricopeptide (TPR) repeat protein
MKEEAIATFEKAAESISRPEPYFYMAVLLNEQYLKEPINTDGFVKILELIEKGLRVGENAHMYYYRAIIYLYLGMNNEALEDIDRAI